MPIYAEKNMRYAHFGEISENAALSEICGVKLKCLINAES